MTKVIVVGVGEGYDTIDRIEVDDWKEFIETKRKWVREQNEMAVNDDYIGIEYEEEKETLWIYGEETDWRDAFVKV